MQELDYSLSVGSVIGDYRIIDILGVGGFGITYKAQDIRMERLVALKEFLPQELAGRSSDASSVIPKTNCADDYQYGLKKFLDEARTLARFNHPNIVRAYTFIEENSTAYLVMEYVEGEALDEHLKKIHFNGNMAESRIREIIEPVLKGLVQVHKAGLLHRDIKPGNIYLQNSSDASVEHGNNPMLIDFGAARQSVGEKSKSISAIISQGYAPPEQYTSRGKQGPYTDIYAIGAVMYYLVTGVKPVESTDRQHELMDEQPDPLTPIEKNRGYSEELIEAITKAMILRVSNRVQDVSELQSILSGTSENSAIINKSSQSAADNDATRKITASHTPEQKAVETSIPVSKNAEVNNSQPSNKKWLVLFLIFLSAGAASFYGYQQYQQKLLAEEKNAQQQRFLMQQDKKAWDLAKSEDTEQSYQAYLAKRPTGNYIKPANQALDDKLVEKEQAQRVKAEQDKVSLIQNAQNLLQQLDYKVSNHGELDTRTVTAIESFEQAQGMVVTGQVDDILLTSLQDAIANQKQEAALKAQRDKDAADALERKKAQDLAAKRKKEQELENIRRQELALALKRKQDEALEIKRKEEELALKQKEGAVPIVRINPKYPIQAARDGIEGWVQMSFTVNEIGGVEDVIVLNAQPELIFNKEAIRALTKWKYRPHIVDGRPVKQTGLTVQLDFKMGL